MTELTARQAEDGKINLEKSAALALGQMLLEFSRLDMALGLVLAWSGEGMRVEEVTKKVQDFSFHKKLDLLQQILDDKYSAESKGRLSYQKWLEDAHTSRVIRNNLVHGRWGIDPYNQQVINVVGLPTSPDQREYRYSINMLEDLLGNMKQLQVRLQEVNKQWPI